MSLKPINGFKMTFSFRLAFLYTAFLAGSFVLLFVIMYQQVSRIVETRDHDVIQAQVEQFSSLFEHGGVAAIENYFSQQIRPIEPIFVRIVDQQNRVRFITASHPLWDLLDQKIKDHSASSIRESHWEELAREEAEGSWLVGALELDGGYFLQVGRSNTESKLVLSHFRRMGLRIFIPALLLSLLGGWLAARSALTPVRALVETIRHILNTGDLRKRVPAYAQRGELGSLGTMFNNVLDKNEALVQNSIDTLDNVAHDLRTPMTHLRNSAEHALQLEAPNLREQREALADCMEESEQILNMLNALMDLADARVGGMSLVFESIGLRELVDQIIDVYSILAEESGIALKNEVPTYLTVEADRVRLRQCLANLIDNALKYSPESSDVVITGSSTDAHISLSVRDHGCGIAAEDLERIWERLYRGERSRATSGLGLGLSMVKAIIEALGGTIEVESTLAEGSEFIIKLPRR